MEALRPDVDVAEFFSHLGRGGRPVLLLDYDGTLAPFREERNLAVPYPGVRERLRRIMESGGSRIVVVSGRAIRDLRPLLGLEPPPELWGSHGWERLGPDGSREGVAATDRARAGLRRGREALDELARTGELVPDRIEEKPVSVAVHVRGLDEEAAGNVSGSVRAAWEPLAHNSELEIHGFDGGLELRASGRDKGTAVREILAREPEGAPVAYLGDDMTDEDAFRALEGRGLSVLVRDELRATAAHLWLRPPEELLEFLDHWHANTHRE